jgi:hypothetical protein
MADEITVMEKAPQVAYCSLKKLHVIPFLKSDGRVAFYVKGDVAGALADLAGNPKVPLLDFLNRLDTVRQIIFTLKEDRGSHPMEKSAARGRQ